MIVIPHWFLTEHGWVRVHGPDIEETKDEIRLTYTAQALVPVDAITVRLKI